jgi:hypothetical protein
VTGFDVELWFWAIAGSAAHADERLELAGGHTAIGPSPEQPQ